MATVLLFHSILGLRAAERETAARFERGGHRVILPDLFYGRTAEGYEEGFALRDRIGDGTILARAEAAVAAAPENAVLSGVSFGAFLVGHFWGDRPRAAGALLFAGVAPWMSPRRAGLPVAAHLARPDPFDDEAVFENWAQEAGDVALALHRYDGVGHSFLDRSLPGYDETAAEACLKRCLIFLNGLGTPA